MEKGAVIEADAQKIETGAVPESGLVFNVDENEDATISEGFFTAEGSQITVKATVAEEGMYNIKLTFAVPSKDVKAVREVLVNGETLYTGASNLTFSYNWPAAEAEKAQEETAEQTEDATEPAQEQKKTTALSFQEAYALNEVVPYSFYLKEGENEITLRAVKGVMILKAITLLPDVNYGSYPDFSTPTYDEYLKNHADVQNNKVTEVAVNVQEVVVEQAGKPVKMYDGEAEAAVETGAIASGKSYKVAAGEEASADEGVVTGALSIVSWKVNVPTEGFYNIKIEYLATDSRGIDIEREILINGEIPFVGSSTLRFSRMWTDEGEIVKDTQGNEIRPRQKELFGWQSAYLRDDKGYQTDPYSFYLNAGENTISFRAVNEPMVIKSIALVPVVSYGTYADYTKTVEGKNVSAAAKDFSLTIQGESAQLRSAPSLYARYDRSSSETVPSSVSHTVMNYIGGNSWTNPGEWIQWEFEVPEDGYYNISIKGRQLYQRGALSYRTVYIDGEIPFAELGSIEFSYSTAWVMNTLGDKDGNAYKFYLEKGKHTIRLEVTLGKMGDIIKEVGRSIDRLNDIYRQLLVVTGPNPDRFRDYSLYKQFPQIRDRMLLESRRLYKIVDDTVAITGEKNDRVAVALQLAVQLEEFYGNEDRLTESFTNFKDNITSLGTAMQNMSESKLDIDLIQITGVDADATKTSENVFDKIAHEVSSCVSSYFVDSNSLGNKYDENDENVIEVWIVTGRDQSTVLKTMIDQEFTPVLRNGRNIGVNLKLVAADAILTAVVAGNGPDVVLSVDGWFAVNYAMRNAVEDLTQFEDFAEITKPFYYDNARAWGTDNAYSSSLATLTYDDGAKKGVYGLPETLNFNVLFYREDILKSMGIEIPNQGEAPDFTWKDIIAMLPTIQGNNYTIAMPFPDIAIADISVMNSMVYQNGGEIYAEGAKKTELNSEAGVAAFKMYTSFYNDYALPTVYDFVSRFRSGEMPLGVASYSTFNTLMISAPEIRGLWNFTYFPGTMTENGYDNTVQSNGLCCMMIATDDQHVKENAWEFMKWWVSAEIQAEFGREMESVLGASARYQTANKDALQMLAWSDEQLEILTKQMAKTKGFPEIAGGYSTTRHITNAIRKVINEKTDPRETLMDYTRTINEEIRIKRQEFNLPVD